MKRIKRITIIITTLFYFGLIACNTGAQPIRIGKDPCSFCKMTISDKNFGAEVLTKKGKIFKFDDTYCLLSFLKAATVRKEDMKEIYIVNYEEPHNLIEVSKAFFLKSSELHSPMGGNVAGFDNEDKAKETANTVKGEIITWDALQKK